MTTCMDDNIERIVGALKANDNMWNSTILLFFADNGGPPYVANSNWPMR
jgi:arylsulfatase A-like enzyme